MAEKQWSASEVIAVFADLGLREVCDDWTAIKAKVDAQRDRRLRDTNKPDPAERHKASVWFTNVSKLEHHRPAMLQAVQGLFNTLAEAALSGFIAAGLKAVTPELKQNLRQIAKDQCKTDDPLADRFLGDFLNTHGLEVGKPTVRPAAITSFKAFSGQGWVTLRWDMPTKDCEEVEIVREPEGQKAQPKTVYRGRGMQHHDEDGLAPAARYVYRARAHFKGTMGADSVQRAVCLAEVRNAAAAWGEGGVALRWNPPGDENTPVVIFRRVGKEPPAVRDDGDGPKPVEANTTQVYRGGGPAWTDAHLVEGSDHHYLIIADFGDGLYSRDGVRVQAKAPRAPSPPPVVHAVYRAQGDKDVVDVKWDPPMDGPAVRYTLVRREGPAPPAHPANGEVLLEKVSQTQHLDEPRDAGGRRFTYAVFTFADGRYSRSGTAAKSVFILSEVRRLTPRTADGVVELQWERPPGATTVLVRRSLSAVRDRNDGVAVPVVGAGARDDHLENGKPLENGKRYCYLVCCGYRPDGGGEVFSAGLRVAVVPDRLPEPAGGLRPEVRGKEIRFHWNPPAHGLVMLLRMAQPHELTWGHRMPAVEVQRLKATPILADAAGQAVDHQPRFQEKYYSLFTVAGDHAVVGDAREVVAFPDVAGLKAATEKSGVLLRWDWPAECAAVRIVRRVGAWPEGPDDPESIRFTCTLDEYRGAANRFLDVIHLGVADLHYVLYAQPRGDVGLSSGADPGCRAFVHWEPWMTLSYEVGAAAKRPTTDLEILWSGRVENPPPDFTGLALVANENRVPMHLTDGVELARWVPHPIPPPPAGGGHGGGAAGEFQQPVRLKRIQDLRWANFYCKALLLQPDLGRAALLIHPNPCVPFMANGRVYAPKSDAPPRRPPLIRPRRIDCPSCFERFGVEEILYTSYAASAEPARPRWPLLARLLGRPPQAPRDAAGHAMLCKLCPKCRRDLPFTAGQQPGVVVGLIGAKYSGKSHYIASLIDRLQNQVGQDMQAALLPVSEETSARYEREFRDPLFKNHQELPLTVGQPPPLIYDLSFDGRLWGKKGGRAVNLSLYDTAGENLGSRDMVQRMVKYLGVASGVMLLVDPLQLDGVRERLRQTVDLPEVDDPKEIIDRVLLELEQGAVLQSNAPLSAPVAVVLTKADLLREAGLIESNRLWCTNERHVGGFKRQAHQDMSGMVGECVQRWHPALYSAVVRRFSRHAFFAASATGCASNAGRYPFIAPWRVEDPLLWLLAEMGIIPIR